MTVLEVDYSQRAGKWGVYDGQIPLTAEGTKQAAKSFAKREATTGDTIQIYTRDGRLDEELIIDENGDTVSAGRGGGGQQGGYGGGQNAFGGGGGLFGGGGWF